MSASLIAFLHDAACKISLNRPAMSSRSLFMNLSLPGPENMASTFAPILNVMGLKLLAVASPRVAAGAWAMEDAAATSPAYRGEACIECVGASFECESRLQQTNASAIPYIWLCCTASLCWRALSCHVTASRGGKIQALGCRISGVTTNAPKPFHPNKDSKRKRSTLQMHSTIKP